MVPVAPFSSSSAEGESRTRPSLRGRLVTRACDPRALLWRRAVQVVRMSLLVWSLCWPAWNSPAAQEGDALEQRVKAAYLYKFAGYVEWPSASFARADTPVTIAVMGDESLAAELDQAVAGRTVNDRRMIVRRLKAGESLAGVHILFVGRSEGARLPQLARATQPQSILTVTESDGALAQGSIINLVVLDRRIRFEVSLESAEKSKLKLSSRLLAVATQVRSGNP